jgi:poly(beta-D-mannuronate) C5 epimerase
MAARVFLALLICAGVGGAALGPMPFVATVLVYFLINVAYSFLLKRVPYVDVGIIALGFVLRVLGGGFGTLIHVSGYLFACTAVLALFLGFGKRRHELAAAERGKGKKQRAVLESYSKLAPPAGRPQMALRPADGLPELGHFSDAGFLAGMARRQARPAAEALVVLRGSYRLDELARAVADASVLAQDGDVFTLRRPLVIRRGAALMVDAGSEVRLSTRRGAFVVNGGQLTLRDASVTSWSGRRGAPSRLGHDRRFRPFVAAIGGSWTGITGSTLSHLGYRAAKSYGLSLVSGPAALPAAAPPTGRITESRITGNYYGLYSYEADDLLIAGNLFDDNIVYGIDPHDRSRGLVIAGNSAIGTLRRHGIVVSRGVSDSWIFDNRAIGNAGTGIVIDAASSGNVVADNLAGANRGDGISLFESGHNLVWGNLAIGNRKSGLRIRNSWGLEVHHNRFVGNGYDGVEAYAEALAPALRNDWRAATELRLGLSLGDNRFVGNARDALSVRRPGRIELFGLQRAADAPPLRLGGDLRPRAAEIAARLEHAGSVCITGTTQPPSDLPRNLQIDADVAKGEDSHDNSKQR